jgi:hypothetical protein
MSDEPSKDRYLSTYTGKKFYPYDPRPEQICIEDIAHGLSMLCDSLGNVVFSSVSHSIPSLLRTSCQRTLSCSGFCMMRRKPTWRICQGR